MKQIAQKITWIVFLTFIVSPIALSQQSDSSSYFPLGFWGIWYAIDQPPFTAALSPGQWIQERDNWRDIKGNYLVSWTPMWVEDSVIQFCDMNNYKMAVTNSTFQGNGNTNSLLNWLREGDLADTNVAISIINEIKTKFNGHSGFHSYFFDDEFSVGDHSRWSGIEFAARKIHELDPGRKSYISSGPVPPQTFFDSTQSLDIFQFDQYSFHFSDAQTYAGQQYALGTLIPYYTDLMNRLRGKRTEWQAIIQTQEDIAGGNNYRRPNFHELRVQAYLALSRGARGVTSYIYGSRLAPSFPYRVKGLVDVDPFYGNIRRRWEDAHPPGIGETTPFQNVKNLNLELAPLGPTIRKLKVYGAFLNSPTIPANVIGISSVSGDKIEIGTFKRIDTGTDSTKYFMLVNRVCNDASGAVSSPQSVTVTFNSSSSQEIIETVSGNIWIVGPSGNFTDILNPGSGKLYKISPATYTATRTVAAGKTMTISKGATLTFGSGALLSVNGTLNAVGTSSQRITFTRSGSSGFWGGVQFNSGSSGSIQYSNITYAYTGIYCGGASSPVIRNNNINNYAYYGINLNNAWPSISYNAIAYGMTGIYCAYIPPGYGPILLRNSITNQSSVGLYCYNSSPNLLEIAQGGHNVIKQNGLGISATYYGDVQVGLVGPDGHNCVHNNTGYAISASYGTTVEAENTWWNRTPPTDTNYYYVGDFSVSYGGSIDYIPNNQHSDPNCGQLAKSSSNGNPIASSSPQDASVSNVSTAGSTSEDPSLDDEVRQLVLLEIEGKYEEAIAGYAQKLKNETIKERMKYLLVRLAWCYRRAEKKGFTEFLNNEIRSKISKDDEMYATTLELENMLLIDNGSYQKAIENFTTLRTSFAKNEATYKHALFNTGNLYYHELNDTAKAKEYFDELKSKYPDDELTLHARILLGELDGAVALPGLKKGSDKAKIAAVTAFALFDNYPNPFNPTTTIRYALAEESHVVLKIYDVLGREVETLVNEEKPAGFYDVSFDASHLSNGIYFYRIHAGGFTESKKMILMK